MPRLGRRQLGHKTVDKPNAKPLYITLPKSIPPFTRTQIKTSHNLLLLLINSLVHNEITMEAGKVKKWGWTNPH